jgi:hypothetical protein
MSEQTTKPSWDPVEYLKSLHTKQILAIRDAIYRVSGINRYDIPETEAGYDPFDSGGRCWVTLAEVKAELALRPHVPNKAEAKVIRQEKAKAKRNR